MKVCDYGLIFARSIMRIWLSIKERKRRRALDSAIKAAAKQCNNMEGGNYRATSVFMNVGFFFLLAERDIQAVKVDALTHHDWWKRNLSLRIILLTICELDMDKVTGRALKEAMDAVNISDPLKSEMHESLRDIRKAQHAAKEALKGVRNATIAHRDPNALLQYKMIQSIDQDLVISLTETFYEASHRFLRALSQIMVEGSTLEALFRQILNRDSSAQCGLP